MKLVKLPNDSYVNPDFVTSIEYCEYSTCSETKVWVVGHAGYHTYSFNFPGNCRDELSKIINA